MAGRFAYSFDRETYHGQFNSRADALAAGLQHLADEDVHGETVFVGKRTPVELGLDHLADSTLKQLQERLRPQIDSDEPLLKVNEHQLADLDARLQQAVRDWMTAGGLSPAGSKVTAISEHATETSAADALR